MLTPLTIRAIKSLFNVEDYQRVKEETSSLTDIYNTDFCDFNINLLMSGDIPFIQKDYKGQDDRLRRCTISIVDEPHSIERVFKIEILKSKYYYTFYDIDKPITFYLPLDKIDILDTFLVVLTIIQNINKVEETRLYYYTSYDINYNTFCARPKFNFIPTDKILNNFFKIFATELNQLIY